MQELYVLNKLGKKGVKNLWNPRIAKVSGWIYIHLFAALIPGVVFKTVFNLRQGKQLKIRTGTRWLSKAREKRPWGEVESRTRAALA